MVSERGAGCLEAFQSISCKAVETFLRFSYSAGRQTVKVMRLSALSAEIVPPWSCHDLLGYGQAKARASRPGGAGAVQAEELLEDTSQLLRRDGPPLVGKGEDDLPRPHAGRRCSPPYRGSCNEMRCAAGCQIPGTACPGRRSYCNRSGQRAGVQVSPFSARIGARTRWPPARSIRARSTGCFSSSRWVRLKRVMSKNSLIRSSSRSALSRAMSVYRARSSREI